MNFKSHPGLPGGNYLKSLANRWDDICRRVLLFTFVRPTMFDEHVKIFSVTLFHTRNTYTFCYVSAFRRRRHYAFGLSVRPSVRPSVRSLKYPLLTCTWVRWSTRPTVTVLRHVRPSVRPERFPGISRRMHVGICLKLYMLIYLDHLQNWLVYGCSLLIFLILALFWLSETGQIWGFRAFPGERMEGMAWNFARWCILSTFRTD